MKIYKIAMAMKQESDMPPDWDMSESVSNNSISIEITDKIGDYQGNIFAERIKGNTWVVLDVNAQHGFGPMLYDKVMRYVTDKSGHLMSNQEAKDRGVYDSGQTSDEAQSVWDQYRFNRNDVEETEHGFRFRPEKSMRQEKQQNSREQENNFLRSLGLEGAKQYFMNKHPHLNENNVLSKLRSLGLT